jgi:hypothetical protein
LNALNEMATLSVFDERRLLKASNGRRASSNAGRIAECQDTDVVDKSPDSNRAASSGDFTFDLQETRVLSTVENAKTVYCPSCNISRSVSPD